MTEENIRAYRDGLVAKIREYDMLAITYANQGEKLCAMMSGSYSGLLTEQLDFFDKKFPEAAKDARTRKILNPEPRV